jgi:hypothetical protein
VSSCHRRNPLRRKQAYPARIRPVNPRSNEIDAFKAVLPAGGRARSPEGWPYGSAACTCDGAPPAAHTRRLRPGLGRMPPSGWYNAVLHALKDSRQVI